MARAGRRSALGDIGNLVDGRCYSSSNLKDPDRLPPQDPTKSFIPHDRPITRQYGAILAKTQLVAQNTGKENDGNIRWKAKQSRTSSPEKKETQNRAAYVQIDVSMDEKEEDGSEQSNIMDCATPSIPPPLSEIDEFESCEIEMEEAESPTPRIDESDVGNPLAVVDYIEDIHNHYRATEIMSCLAADYMSKQTDINHRMRAILVDWLIEVHHKFDLRHETLFLAVNLIDRYLSVENVMRKSLQLVGITGMLLACKYEEVYVPALEDFVIISDRAYSREDVLKMERSILNTLQFSLSVPTPFVFMRRFLKAAESETKLEMVAFYLIELCLVEYQMLKFPPSMLSAAAIYAGKSLLKHFPLWNKTLTFHSTYSEEQIQECAKLIEDIHRNAGVGKLTSVYRKYSISKFRCVAKLTDSFLHQL
ncbi:G2/mitotic-specific cyclin-2-like [Nymphaea colorata]|nr:G2/mitotic-specific cyclin-2-like [Nymphaea colorata]